MRVDVASLELTLDGCFDCFVPRLFPLLCLPLAVVFMTRIAVHGLQFLLKSWYDISSSKPVNSNEIAESSSQSEQSLKIKPFPLFTKSLSAMKRTSTLDAIISWQRWVKVCTSRETNFRLIQAFNRSKSNFGLSQGLDWAFPSLSHYGSWYYYPGPQPN